MRSRFLRAVKQSLLEVHSKICTNGTLSVGQGSLEYAYIITRKTRKLNTQIRVLREIANCTRREMRKWAKFLKNASIQKFLKN